MNTYDIYTDGGYSQAKERGGYASYIVNTGDLIYGFSNYSTNNRMELSGVINALNYIPDNSHVHLYSDSMYVLNGIKSWMYNWAKNNWTSKNGPLKNIDLWQQLYQHARRLKITCHWVKGHSGNPHNELCDEIASYMIKK